LRLPEKIRAVDGGAARSLAEILREAGIEVGARAEQLTLAQFAALYHSLGNS
jgi:16S rRNA A1518/A1519 N6-dimethyltransferase RsmA/KsgA/DIM1 with predicted DNA glycosylase/AP lyase activity